MTWPAVALILGVPLALSVVVHVVMNALDLVDSDATHNLVMTLNESHSRLCDRVAQMEKVQMEYPSLAAIGAGELDKVNTQFGKLHDEILSLDERLKFVEGRPTTVSPFSKPSFARK